jgi:hypothetical protein
LQNSQPLKRETLAVATCPLPHRRHTLHLGNEPSPLPTYAVPWYLTERDNSVCKATGSAAELLSTWMKRVIAPYSPCSKSVSMLLGAAVWRRACVAFDPRQQAAEGFRPAIGSDDPRPVAPWWMMPDMLVVATLELSHPVLLIVLMKADNVALHGCSLLAYRSTLSSIVRPPVQRGVACSYLPCACSRPIPAAMITIANARTSVRGAWSASNPTRSTSAVACHLYTDTPGVHDQAAPEQVQESTA